MPSIIKNVFFFPFFVGCLAMVLRLPEAQGLNISVKQIPSLKTIPVPGPSEEMLAQFVVDKKAAILLGKALFWDQQVGSDNKTACATCHFHAGADNRVKNQMNPGQLANDSLFDLPGSGPNLYFG